MSKVASREDGIIRRALSIAGSDAYKNALDKGVTVTIVHGDKIERVFPNGRKELVRALNNKTKRVVSRQIRLK